MDIDNLKKNAEQLGVSPEVYLFLRRSNRKIRYFACDLKQEKIIIDGDSVTFIPSREDSFDRLGELGLDFAAEQKCVEDIALDRVFQEQLHTAIGKLNEGEQRLIEEIFFSNNGRGKSEREAAQSLGIAQKTLNNRKHSALEKLRKALSGEK